MKLRLSAVGLCIAILLAQALTTSVSRAQTSSKPLKKITVVVGTAFESANDIVTVVLPQELGYFAEEGVQPDIQFSSAGGQVLQLVQAGRADIGFGSSVQVSAARAQGAPIKAIYNILRTASTAIAVPTDGPIKSARDLKGKTIGIVAVGSARALDGRAMVRAAGLNPDTDVKWAAVGLGAQALQALRTNQVQALSLWDAAYADMENRGEKFHYFKFPFQRDLFSVVWIATDKAIADNPDVIAGFGRAEAKATVFAMNNPRAAVEIYLKAHPELIPAGQSHEQAFNDALNILQNNLHNMELQRGVREYGSFTKKGWEEVQNYYHELGLIQKPIADVSAYYVSPSLVKKMNEFNQAAIAAKAKGYGT